MHHTFTSFICAGFLVLPVISVAQSNLKPILQWGVGTGINHYKEPGFMQLKGQEVGLHARAYNFARLPQLHLEGDLFFGQQDYSSEGTGTMNGVHNVESRWRALMPIYANTPKQHGLYAGLGIHTLWNDLRGISTTGNGGYERRAKQLWLPVRWVSNFWEVEGGVLVYGKHTSMLSQVNTTPPSNDVVNTQKKGVYVQGKLNVQLDARHALSPYVRYTGLSDSDKVSGAYEPASNRWQAGVTWELTTR
jgi:hypothetical protein